MKLIKKLLFVLLIVCMETMLMSVLSLAEEASNSDPLLTYLITYRDAVVSAQKSTVEVDNANAAITARQVALGMTPVSVPVNKMKKKDAQAMLDNIAAASAPSANTAASAAATTPQAGAVAPLPTVNTQAAIATNTALTTTSAQAVEKGAKKQAVGVILVGDSRFVQMHEAMGDTGATFMAQNSKGYDWFVENAIPRIDPLVTKGTTIVINLGVNDLGNIDKYLSKVNAKAVEWKAKGAKVYYATVNPVWENPYSTEEGVVAFNTKLVNGIIGVDIIDTHSFLVANGYKLVDGLHYDGPTYANIYYYIMSQI